MAFSLFDGRPEEVLNPAAALITGPLAGEFAISLCVIAVAIVGLMLMTGRLVIRDGMRVVIGCFILLGAPLVANGLRTVVDEASPSYVPSEPSAPDGPSQAPLPAANYDPYAGASLRQN
jgi:type IV secretory pathway VirB2 component (pilin)